jgi:hypothetical protein
MGSDLQSCGLPSVEAMRLNFRVAIRLAVAALAVLIPIQVAVAHNNDEPQPQTTPVAQKTEDFTPLRPVGTPVTGATAPEVTKSATLPQIDLGTFQNALLPGSIKNDRNLKLGSIGSGLFRVGANEYWTVTDRGPNGEPYDDVHNFLLPEFDPTLVRIKVKGTKIEVVDSIPITTTDGKAVTGLPNRAFGEESLPYASDVVTVLPYNPNGLDPEGVARTADGHFWISDEYAPSILELDAEGHVLARHVPAGAEEFYKSAGVGYPVKGSLPAGLVYRKDNRGLEDIALLPDGKTIVAALQSSIVVPGQKDRIITELISFDTAKGKTLHEYAYKFDEPTTFAPGTRGRKLKISALIPVDQDHVIVQERTDDEARFYLVKLDPADDLITEQDKTLVANLAGVQGVPGKIEGAALKTKDTLVLTSDDDFGFVQRPYALDAPVEDSGVRTTLIEVKLK